MGNCEQLTRMQWPISSDSVVRPVEHETVGDPNHSKEVILVHIPSKTCNQHSADMILYFSLLQFLAMRISWSL